MLISWDESTNQLHLCNGRISYIARVLEDGSFGHLHFGPALTPGRSYRHLGPDRFEGFSNRVGEPIAREQAAVRAIAHMLGIPEVIVPPFPGVTAPPPETFISVFSGNSSAVGARSFCAATGTLRIRRST